VEKELQKRLAFLEYGASIAFAASSRGSCPRRYVGAALFDSHKIVASTGCNGAPAGAPQCDEIGCLMVDNHCKRAIHAERNASVFAGKRDLRGGYAFVTIRPCDVCFKILVELGIKHVYYLEEYRPETAGAQKSICRDRGVSLEQLPFNLEHLIRRMIQFHQNPGGLFSMNSNLKIISS